MDGQDLDEERKLQLRQEKRARKSMRRMQRVAAALQAAPEDAPVIERKRKSDSEDDKGDDLRTA